MTTLRVEVGRACGTTVEDVVEGLWRAGCMKHLEINPDAFAFLPIEELRQALIARGFYVELVPDPPPPPLPWWRWVRTWPRRVYYWGRRLVLRETEVEQLARAMFSAYGGADGVQALATRESPIMALMRQPEAPEDPEPFILKGRGTSHRDDWHPVCWKCGARYPNGPGQYAAKCPECGETWDGSEASDPPLGRTWAPLESASPEIVEAIDEACKVKAPWWSPPD